MKLGRVSPLGMGGWRLLLAALVAASHLWQHMTQGYAAYAVWGFFALSGFLMTYVLKNKYGFSLRGTAAYAYNRLLRIFPGYYVALLIGVATLLAGRRYGVQFTGLNGQFYLPEGWFWLNPLTNLSVFQITGLPVPVSNALAIEVTMYLLMPLLAVSWAAAALVAIMSAVLTIGYFGFDISTFASRYALFMPCMLAFAWGSLTCHFRDRLTVIEAPSLSVVVWMIHGALWVWFPYWPWTYGLYASLPLSSWVVISLFSLRTGKLDRWLGDLSYPIYLLHTIVGAWLWQSFDHKRTLLFLGMSSAITLVLAAFIVACVERPLQRIKLKALRMPVLRPSSSQADPAPDFLRAAGLPSAPADRG